jgi:hypothetical protein
LMPQSAGKTNKKLKKIIFFLNLDTIWISPLKLYE